MRKPTYDEVKLFTKKGLSVPEIASIFGVTRQRIYQVLDKHYNKRRKKIYTGALQDA